MLKNIGFLCLLMSNATNFGMSRQLTSRLPIAVQSYMPSSLTQTQKTSQPTISISSQDLAKRVNDLFQQHPPYAQRFKNHAAYQELELLKISPLLQQDIVLQHKIMILHEILQYCQQHPEETEDIMIFYTNMENVDFMIKEKLAQQPQHFQRFFNQQLQQYMQEPYHFAQAAGSTWIKELILKLFSYRSVALKITIRMLILFLLYETQGLFHGQEINDQDLVQAIELLQDALDIPNTSVKKQRRPSMFVGPLDAGYHSDIYNIIILTPNFFELSLAAQITILLHEMRHVLQTNGAAELSTELLKYANACNLNLGLKLHEFFQYSFFWSSALQEFDADNFAYEQMKNSPLFKKIVEETSVYKFNPNTGYFSADMALHKAPLQETFIAKTRNKWKQIADNQPVVNNQENKYLQHIPEHLKQAAAKNRQARAQVSAQKQNATLLDTYLEKLEADF